MYFFIGTNCCCFYHLVGTAGLASEGFDGQNGLSLDDGLWGGGTTVTPTSGSVQRDEEECTFDVPPAQNAPVCTINGNLEDPVANGDGYTNVQV